MVVLPSASGDTGSVNWRRRRVANAKVEPDSSAERVTNLVQSLDAFTKVPEECQERRVSGGGATLITFLFICLLVWSELVTWRETRLRYEYNVDVEHAGRVRINMDITVAMRCALIGADVLDSTGRELQDNGQLEEHNIHWKLSTSEERDFRQQRAANVFLAQEHHALQDLLWRHRSHINDNMLKTPLKSKGVPSKPGQEPNACRIRGFFTVNKVAGNLHITAGKPFDLFGNHAHMTMQMERSDYNFSHRIHHFSFGRAAGGRIHPLDATEVIASDNYQMFQYFVKIVPIAVRTRRANVDTYQFAVQEHHRPIDHNKGSHGLPGIFIKYDVSPLLVSVNEESESVWTLLVRLAAGAGGLFATSTVITGIMQLFADGICCRWKLGRYSAAPLDLKTDAAGDSST